MSTKTITITEEAYQALASRKETRESFSDVIRRTFKKTALLDLAGILSHSEADELRRNVAERRKHSRKHIDEVAKRL